MAAVFISGLTLDDALPLVLPKETPPAFSVRVIDGDTIDLNGERIRIANIDAPEMPGRAACPHEAELALSARRMLQAQIDLDPTSIEIVRQVVRPKDRYGRTLARVYVTGEDVADALIAAGVARPWRGRSSEWC